MMPASYERYGCEFEGTADDVDVHVEEECPYEQV